MSSANGQFDITAESQMSHEQRELMSPVRTERAGTVTKTGSKREVVYMGNDQSHPHTTDTEERSQPHTSSSSRCLTDTEVGQAAVMVQLDLLHQHNLPTSSPAPRLWVSGGDQSYLEVTRGHRMEKTLICRACHMVFRSTRLLEKHTAKFCIGGGGVDAKQTRAPDLLQTSVQRRIPVRRSRAEAELESGAEDKRAIAQTDGGALRNLTDEFHRLRMSIEENLPNWSGSSEPSPRHLGHTEGLKEMREMATLHQRQVALIHAHHRQLEQQRDELAHQVSVLSEQSRSSQLDNLLMELREQEERNEETLQYLARHLHALNVRPADQLDPAENTKMHPDNYKLITSVDGPLSAQIKALRLTYMQSGGSDPAVVAQMTDLQAEAQSLEENHGAAASAEDRSRKVRPRLPGPSWELLALEQENQRLEEEILRMQLDRERKQDNEAAVRTEHWLIQREKLQQSLQAEVERGGEAPWSCRQPPPLFPLQTKTHSQAPFPLLKTRSFSSTSGRHVMDPLDSLGPAPYDPAAGFVVFFDLALGVDASQKALRLVAALCSEGVEVGPPTPLPPVQCLPGLSSPYSHSLAPGNYALLSVKQPVPRIQPSASLCLVVEVQAARDLDVHNQEVFRLSPSGWTRLELFDQHNQLCSGHWRMPVRCLPVKPSLSIAQLNTVHQVGHMELCVRLANSRDEDMQTLVRPDPASTRHYRYQAVVSSLHATGQAAPSVSAPSAPQPTEVNQPCCPLSSTHHTNPPPTDGAGQS
ncbi:coiled-coil domain-containing protein 17 [Pleuronectes platessa]|uniref:coiled-coil domain-containing protein 17 n=1 Tax=Pleuronectes platessa TaxID=8262 RepID=UPI00232A17E4|nr:coiled-coil domain-containing protein 17 [Pleuronectes platessa]